MLPFPAPVPHNVPRPATPFVGRAPELALIAQHLADPDCRLLTLIGPGGTGKTRLAMEVATELHDTFADGVYFIPLAPIREPELVLATIAQALAIIEAPSQPVLKRLQIVLREKHMLLVLDNFEHLVEGGAEVVRTLLERAPTGSGQPPRRLLPDARSYPAQGRKAARRGSPRPVR